MQSIVAPNPGGSFGLSANQLKLIAILCMFIDHFAHLFVPYGTPLYIAMRFVGRITGPTMFYLSAAGYHYTRNVNKYMARLAVFAVVSYIPFIFAFTGSIIPQGVEEILRLNVIYTIFMGVTAIRVRRSSLPNGVKFIALIGIYALATFGDWGIMCISIMLVFDIFQGDFQKQFWGYLAVMFLQGGLLTGLIFPIYYFQMGMPVDFSMYFEYISQFGTIIPIFILSRYNGQKGRGGALAKYSFYIFYPAHLLILGYLAHVVFA